MKSKGKYLIGILIVVGLVFIFNIPTTKAIQREATISNIADKDTYIDTGNPLSNYGGVNNLMTGFSILSDIREAYFHFNFSNKPSSFTRAEISLDFWGVSQTMNFTVCIIEEDWGEYTLDWTSQPTKGQVIGNIITTSSGIYTLDITSLIAGRTNLSICVYIEIDNYVADYAYVTSREGYYFVEDAPQLLWVYMETVEINVISPTSSDEWERYDYHMVTWTSLGPIDRVTIQLFKGTDLIDDITFLYTDNDGSYEAYCSSSYEVGSDYRIKITDYDDANVYDYSDYFSIITGGIGGNGIPSYNLLIILGIIGVVSGFLYKKIRNKKVLIH